VRGKLAYSSPEQLGARPLDGRSDLFSLAVVLHEWIAGAPLFACDSDAATVQAVQAANIPPLSRAPRLGAVLARALSRDPARRFADGEAFADALLEAAGGRPAAPERLVGAHVRALFPDRERRWQAIVGGRPLVASPPGQDAGEVGGGRVAGQGGTVASASAFAAATSSATLSASASATFGTGTLAKRRRRRIALSLAAAAGLASLIVGFVRRDPLSSPARVGAVPAVSEARATVVAPDVAVGSLAARPSPASPASPPAATTVATSGKGALGARASLTSRGGQRRRVHHATASAAGARRAIVDELEPSPYARR